MQKEFSRTRNAFEEESAQRSVFDFPFLTDALQHPVLGGGSNVRRFFGAVGARSCNDATKDFDGNGQLVAVHFGFTGNFIASLSVVLVVVGSGTIDESSGKHLRVTSNVAETFHARESVLFKGRFRRC